jgi:hypothetical protein
MRKMTVVAGVAILLPVFGASGAKTQTKPQGQVVKPPVVEEPPIKVRNGSMEIKSETRWGSHIFSGSWKQKDDTLDDDNGILYGLVVKTSGDPCRVKGDEIFIYYSRSGSPSPFEATLSRDKKKVKLSPKGGFERDATEYIATHKTNSTEDYITKVRGSSEGTCELASKAELKLICIDSKDPDPAYCVYKD